MNESYVEIPQDILSLNHVVALEGDGFFANGVPFIITMSTKMQNIHVECLPICMAKELTNSLLKVIQIYAGGGFNVRTIFKDIYFKKLNG